MAVLPSAADRQSYAQILKSTVLIGGSSLINIGFSIIRNKLMAVLLGPAGIGLMGVYGATADIAHSLGGLGVNASGVRQIAEAVGSNDANRIARTAIVLRRVSLLLGLLGAALLALFAGPISRLTFGNEQHVNAIILLSVAVFFQIVSAGQAALLQGMRQIGSLARINVLAAFFSTATSIPLIYFFRDEGVVMSIVCVAAITTATSWWYSRRVRIERAAVSLKQVFAETRLLLRLGSIFMVSAFLTVGSSYAIRIIVLNQDGVAAAGLYQAAWALGGLYAGFILQAMGTDFYPRLTAVANDNLACNRLVNEQVQISILLAGPGLLATLTFAPLAMHILYTPEFNGAVDLLRWICLGMMLRIIAWPIGFIVLAKGVQKAFFWTEVAAAVVHVGLAWVLVRMLGVTGAGVAFLGLYLWHSLLISWVAHRLSAFRLSTANRGLVLTYIPLAACVFSAFQILSFWQATALGSAAAVLSGVHSLKILTQLLPPESLPWPIRGRIRQSA
ncbi:MAG: O-antigen translocase [Rhizobium sp.]|jgi:PST family polysaccharide transporter|uniref:O-antigen translocase n=1 Tax=Rhizobium sp. TaxID=391 RepID=UPI000564C8DF